MLNAIQHGVTIANLRIRRKEQQCGLRNIGDWGEGLNHVGEKLALVAKVSGCFWHQKTEHKNKGSRSKKMAGMNGQDPLMHHRPLCGDYAYVLGWGIIKPQAMVGAKPTPCYGGISVPQ